MRIIALLLICLLSAHTFAQEATQDSAPTKTADPTETAPSNTHAVDAAAPQLTVLESPFLQSDLELIVGNVQRPNGIVWFDDSLYTVCNGDWTIYKINDRTGETITYVFGVRNGNSIVAEPTEAGFNLWVPDPDTGALWKVDERRAAPESISADLEAPWGLTRLDEGSFLITDTRSDSIMVVPLGGAPITAHSDLRSPTGIVRDENKVYFANGGSARRGIEFFEIADDGTMSAVQPLVSGLQNTTNMAMGRDGYLYFSYALGTRGVVGRIDPTACLESGCSNQDVEMVVFSDVPAPLAIALSDDLRLFLHSRFKPEFYWVQLPV
ncbi:MAG: hypothetical protein OXI30_10090 [Chloroflexota bacterium]|nr:hypothetical protein [Chloroflexota bacterium]